MASLSESLFRIFSNWYFISCKLIFKFSRISIAFPSPSRYQSQQQVFGTDIAVSESICLFFAISNDVGHSLCKLIIHKIIILLKKYSVYSLNAKIRIKMMRTRYFSFYLILYLQNVCHIIFYALRKEEYYVLCYFLSKDM